MHSNPLQELVLKKVCISFRGMYTKLFKHIEIKKHNIFFLNQKPLTSYFSQVDIQYY